MKASSPKSRSPKSDPKKSLPDAKHLQWLVKSRMQNQSVCAELYDLLRSEPECWKSGTLGYDAKTLISIGFSLWRAAFLADKSGELKETNAHAIAFLGDMLQTNSIAFSNDRNARGFTFNYYLANVRFRLKEYRKDHSDFKIDDRLSQKGMLTKESAQNRWSLY